MEKRSDFELSWSINILKLSHGEVDARSDVYSLGSPTIACLRVNVRTRTARALFN